MGMSSYVDSSPSWAVPARHGDRLKVLRDFDENARTIVDINVLSPTKSGRPQMGTSESFIRTPEAGATLNILGTTHIYKATAAETGGSFSLWELVIPPGSGPPPHTHHREDEAFYVLSGVVMF